MGRYGLDEVKPYPVIILATIGRVISILQTDQLYSFVVYKLIRCSIVYCYMLTCGFLSRMLICCVFLGRINFLKLSSVRVELHHVEAIANICGHNPN